MTFPCRDAVMTPFPRFPRYGQQRAARAHLKHGGVMAYATESCFGLGCDPFNVAAIRRILAIKARPNHKGLIVIAANLAQLAPLIKPLTAAQLATVNQYWPGPFTFLLPASERVPALLRGKHDKIAVRVTAHGEAAALCRALGSAVVSTSANRSGQVSLKSARQCRMAFGARVLTVSGHIGKRRKPSTIIDLDTGRVLR